VVTTILAATLLHERMNAAQISGAALAVLAVVLIGVG
jgi:drug/metabolite transporter (DMT)-like permease